MKVLVWFFLSLFSTCSLASASTVESVDLAIKKLLPKESIKVRYVNDNLALYGDVTSVELSKKALEIASQFIGNDKEVINMMNIKHSQQVMIKVKYGEIDRSKYSTISTMSFGSLSKKLEELEKAGIFKVYSEPSLIAISGETAYFSSGGELSVPVYESGNMKSVHYKPYGIKLSFTPKVITNSNIRISVEHEVVEPSNSSKLGMTNFKTAHTSTTVELAPGESFMVAGLVSDNVQYHKHQKLFGMFAPGYKNEQKEIVVAITPYFVKPVPASHINMPTDNFDIRTEVNNMIKNKTGSYFRSSEL